jgi:hypothetical protein
MNCKICNADAPLFCEGEILRKYKMKYYKCSSCGFVQTEEPYWLNEAYNSAIAQLDIGLIERNQYFVGIVEKLILMFYPKTANYLDYGGGYGAFVRMMRDKGFSFYRYDTYCENIFANHFDMSDAPVKKFDIVTAFEVFEHLKNPMEEISKMLALGDTIFFSTILTTEQPQQFMDWWYRAPLSGQHIAFYTKESLEYIAKKLAKKLYSNGSNFHVLTNVDINREKFADIFSAPRERSFMERLVGKFKTPEPAIVPRRSLQQEDYKKIEQKILQEKDKAQ